MQFWNPLPVEGLTTVLRELPIPRGAAVLDYGCGVGEVSLELAKSFGARVTGVDPNPDAIDRCRAKVAGTFLVEAFQAERFARASFDLVVNIGASPGMQSLLQQIVPLLKQPGHLLVGDIYWCHPPSDELLLFLGQSSTRTQTIEDHHAALAQAGFIVERTVLATTADWDRYEDEYDANMVAYLTSHPGDPSFDVFERRRCAWRAMYLEHGRGTLGFALLQARQGA